MNRRYSLFIIPLMTPVWAAYYNTNFNTRHSCTQHNCTVSETAQELYESAQFAQEQIAKATGLKSTDDHYKALITSYRDIFQGIINHITRLSSNQTGSTPKLRYFAQQLIQTLKNALEALNYSYQPKFMNGLLALYVAQVAAIAGQIRLE